MIKQKQINLLLRSFVRRFLENDCRFADARDQLFHGCTHASQQLFVLFGSQLFNYQTY